MSVAGVSKPESTAAQRGGEHPSRYSEAARELLRDRVLDALGELLGNGSWSELTMANIAARAGVSRQTLYNSFGSRAELAQVYLAREAEGFLAAVESRIRDHHTEPLKALTSALEGFLETAQTHPLIGAIVSREGTDELLPLVTTRGGPLLSSATERLTDSILEAWPGLARGDAAPLADVLVRLAISYAALPAGPPERTARWLARVIGPTVDHLWGEVHPTEPLSP